MFHIIDPTVHCNEEKFHCVAYKTDPRGLAPITKTGDIILMKNVHVVIYHGGVQGKLYSDSGRFAVVEDGGFAARAGSHFSIPSAAIPVITHLRTWYADSAETVVAEAERKRTAEVEEKRLREAQGLGAALPQPGTVLSDAGVTNAQEKTKKQLETSEAGMEVMRRVKTKNFRWNTMQSIINQSISRSIIQCA